MMSNIDFMVMLTNAATVLAYAAGALGLALVFQPLKDFRRIKYLRNYF